MGWFKFYVSPTEFALFATLKPRALNGATDNIKKPRYLFDGIARLGVFKSEILCGLWLDDRVVAIAAAVEDLGDVTAFVIEYDEWLVR